ncbi:phosphatidate phosphatase LPIN3-like isoform X2 [Corticium candelabrum]|uniref:phosphatidate phosphatase LPIN3-like isoform X2 n=1 Tax=Corticium candelabrum TaxID=121492 RepID=UPI002E26E73C|nr:phosphatidate phosphatase LPIN3-like isoform X2 [Corticium candelabrum]
MLALSRQMKLGDSGVAFFVEEVEENVPTELATSPLPGHEDAAELMAKGVRQLKEELAAAEAADQHHEPVITDASGKQTLQGLNDTVFMSGGKGRGSLVLRKFHRVDHPFSDSEDSLWLTPGSYRSVRQGSCPLSDTEAEMQQRKDKMLADSQSMDDSVTWNWGGLPQETPRKSNTQERTPSATQPIPCEKSRRLPTPKPTTEDTDKMENPTFLSSVMRLVSRRKSKRFSEGSLDIEEGIYLNQIDNEEQAAQYFPKVRVELVESKQNESAVVVVSDEKDGVIDSGTSSDQDAATSPLNQSQEIQTEESNQNGDMLSAIESLGELKLSLCGGLKDPDTVIPEEKFSQYKVTYDAFCEKPSILSDPNLVVKLGGRFYNWQVALPMIFSVVAFRQPLPQKKISGLVKEHMSKKRRLASWFTWRRQASEVANDRNQTTETAVTQSAITQTQVGVDQDDRSKHEDITLMSSDEDIIIGEEDNNTSSSATPKKQSTTKEYRKSLRLSSDQIRSLNLQHGANEAVFSVTTKYQGTTKAKSTIYLWHYTDKIVISDIDGTITKSDLYGQILPFFGNPWAQSGVTELFTSINDNGYQFVYLSARAIGQARTTRGYLKNLKQGEISLPDGPLLLSPSSLYSAFRQEVILKKPEEFKKAALKDIKLLFPPSVNPFYAGFGNRVNDEWAYKDMGVPPSRIFIINPKGEVVHALSCTLQTSYSKLRDQVNTVFPPLTLPHSTVPDEYADIMYWRDPLSLLDDEQLV